MSFNVFLTQKYKTPISLENMEWLTFQRII